MNKPQLKRIEEQAVDIVVNVLNMAQEKLGVRQTLKEFVCCREKLSAKAKVSLTEIKTPIVITSEEVLVDIIEKTWKLTKLFSYCIKYKGTTVDEVSHYYYFEVIFSQPTRSYPIPQATASVFIRVEDSHVKGDQSEEKRTTTMTFRIEGHRSDHDVRYVVLTPDWLLAVIQMKIKLFKKIETLRMF